MLDLSTDVVSSCLVTLLIAGLCGLYGMGRRTDLCTRLMSGAMILAATGAMMRVVVPLFPAVVLGNALILGALGCVWLACRALAGRPALPWLPLVAPAAWTLVCASPVGASDLDLRIGVMAAASGAVTLASVIELWGEDEERVSARGWILGVMGLKAVSDLVRALLAVAWHDPEAAASEASRLNGLTVGSLSSLIYVAMLGFGITAVLREREEARSRDAARRDELTGLNEHGLLTPFLDDALARAVREGSGVALLVADIDGFKAYNDRYGYPAGNRCLRAVGTVVRHALYRPVDAAFRHGEAEFAILLPGTDLGAAEIVAERLHRDLRRRAM